VPDNQLPYFQPLYRTPAKLTSAFNHLSKRAVFLRLNQINQAHIQLHFQFHQTRFTLPVDKAIHDQQIALNKYKYFLNKSKQILNFFL